MVNMRRNIFLTYDLQSIIDFVASTGHGYNTGEEVGLKQRVRGVVFGEGGSCHHC